MSFAQVVVESVTTRGDLGHLALLLWAGGASALCVAMLREITTAHARLDAFVRELALFNQRHHQYGGDHQTCTSSDAGSAATLEPSGKRAP